MKSRFVILFVFCATLLNAQVPGKMSYQAVIRNSAGELVKNAQIGMRISILQGSTTGTAVYIETQTPTTNVNGLISIQFGGGTGFNAIDWSSGVYFLKTETDISGGANYTITGTSQLLSVPYALYAKTAGSSLPGPKGDAGPVPNHEWDGTSLRFENPDGSWGTSVDLKGAQGIQGIQGPKGDKGDKGDTGAQGPAGTSATYPTFAVCAQYSLNVSMNYCQCSGAIMLSRTNSPCTATSQTGSCSSAQYIGGVPPQTYTGTCCVCRPQ